MVWDRSQTHRGRLVREFVARQRGRIELEYLPAYAPELNPVEYIWGYWKHHELPNFCPRDFAQLSYHARRALRRMRRRRLPDRVNILELRNSSRRRFHSAHHWWAKDCWSS